MTQMHHNGMTVGQISNITNYTADEVEKIIKTPSS